ECGDVVMVVLGNDDSGSAGEHAIEDGLGQVVDVVLRRIHDPDTLVVAAGHHEKVPAVEEVIVAVSDANIDDDGQPQVVGDVEQLFVRVTLVEVGAVAEGGGAALEALVAQESAIERDVWLHCVNQVPDGGVWYAPGRQDLGQGGSAARGILPV